MAANPDGSRIAKPLPAVDADGSVLKDTSTRLDKIAMSGRSNGCVAVCYLGTQGLHGRGGSCVTFRSVGPSDRGNGRGILLPRGAGKTHRTHGGLFDALTGALAPGSGKMD